MNRLQQRGRRGAQPPGRQAAPPARPGAPPQQDRPPLLGERERDRERDEESDRGGVGPRQAEQRAEDPFDDLARRLEEARRRVRDAAGDGPSAPEGRGRTIADVGVPSGTVGGGTTRTTVAGGSPATTVAGRRLGTPAAPGTAPAAPPRPPSPATPSGTPGTPQREARQGAQPSAREVAERARRRSSVREAESPALEVDRRVGRSPYGTPGQRSRRGGARDLLSVDEASVRKGLLWHMILGRAAAFDRGRMPSPRRSR